MHEELLLRFLTRACTQAELLEVEEWMATDPANAEWLFEMESVWSLKNELRYSDRKEIDAAYRRFVRASSPVTPKRPLYRSWWKYAAAIIIICLLATNLYQASKNKPAEEVAANMIEVPIGQRVAITLADGTKVWLNSGAILSYPTKFDLKNRVIRLDGEAYFEVNADKERPFIVQTSMLEVKAIGTKFNVKAYPGEDIAVSLLEGELHVKSGEQWALMASNDLVTWSREAGLSHLKNKAPQHAAHWISGELLFVNERFADIAKVLEKRFGVTIIIDNPKLADETFTCRTHPGSSLEQVLSWFKSTKKLNYTIQEKEKTVHVY